MIIEKLWWLTLGGYPSSVIVARFSATIRGDLPRDCTLPLYPVKCRGILSAAVWSDRCHSVRSRWERPDTGGLRAPCRARSFKVAGRFEARPFGGISAGRPWRHDAAKGRSAGGSQSVGSGRSRSAVILSGVCRAQVVADAGKSAGFSSRRLSRDGTTESEL